MAFDFTSLGPGEITIITALAAVVSSFVAALSAFMTALVSGWMTGRRERRAAIRKYKARQLNEINRGLDEASLTAIRILRDGDFQAVAALESLPPVGFPEVFSSKMHVPDLVKRYRATRRKVKDAAAGKAAVDLRITEAAQQFLGAVSTLQGYVEICALHDAMNVRSIKRRMKRDIGLDLRTPSPASLITRVLLACRAAREEFKRR